MAAAAFTLEPSGPSAPCDFPKCVLNAFHEGNHEFATPVPRPRSAPVHHCVVCGRGFMIFADPAYPTPRTCGSQECIIHFARRYMPPADAFLLCCCKQRSYPHELLIHEQIAPESYNPKLRHRYPWSLMLSNRSEPSTERKQS